MNSVIEQNINQMELQSMEMPTTCFFQDQKSEVFEMNAEADKFEAFESMRIYIERFGRPYNYLKNV